MNTTQQGQENGKCPFCGQPYDHKYVQRSNTGKPPTFRSDARVCKSSGIGGRKDYYVHLPGKPDGVPDIQELLDAMDPVDIRDLRDKLETMGENDG